MSERFRFTKTKVANLPQPDKNRAVYYDDLVPKLALRITQAGNRSFYIVKRAGREMVWLKLGTFPDMTVERAREEAEKKLGEFASDSNPAAVRRALRVEPTLIDFFTKEYGPRHGQKLASWRNYLSQFNQYVSPVIGKVKLSAVTREQVARIVSDVEKAGKSGSMVNKIRNLVSGIYRQAIEWGFAESNPVTGIRGRKEKSRSRFLQSNELPRFFASVAEEENTDIRDYILLSLLTGARRSNVVEMRWEHLRLSDAICHLPRTKNDEPQDVTLSPEAVEILRAREGNESAWVFPGKGKTGHLVEPKSGWKRVLDRDEVNQLQARIRATGANFEWPEKLVKPKGFTGRTQERLEDSLARARAVAAKLCIDTTCTRLGDLRLHDLRRTLGSWQAKTGASLVIIGKSLNHKSQSTTAIYARLDLDPVRLSVNTATAAMLEAGGMKPEAEIVQIKDSPKTGSAG
jgi:integrase